MSTKADEASSATLTMNGSSSSNNGSGIHRSWEAIKQDLSQRILSMDKPGELFATLLHTPAILAPIRVCIEAGIFETLAASPTPLTVEQIAAKLPIDDDTNTTKTTNGHDATEAEIALERRDFVLRMLRGAAVHGLVDEGDNFTFAANEVTNVAANPGLAGGYQQVFDNVMGPRSSIMEMWRYHRANGWCTSPTNTDGPWQRANGTVGSTTFESWVAHDPLQLTRLSGMLEVLRRMGTHWTEWFPREALFASSESSKEFCFVDVGGGRGQDVSTLAQKYPDEPMRIVLEDLPSVTHEAKAKREKENDSLDPRITAVAQDFFEPQQVKGADVYYIAKVMHDWPDQQCATILSRVKEAMAPHSRIFIGEFILKNRNSSLSAIGCDIMMLAIHGGRERDEDMWQRLVSMVPGLRVRKFWHSPSGKGSGIVEIELVQE